LPRTKRFAPDFILSLINLNFSIKQFYTVTIGLLWPPDNRDHKLYTSE
jgi:hypothetical protein